jgi:hypothetical protein
MCIEITSRWPALSIVGIDKLDDEIEEVQQDRNRLLSELCKAINTINQLRAEMDDS